MTVYPALIHQDKGKPGYGVTFPDFPGCVSAGETIEEARTMAEEALELHLEGMAEDGEAIPVPSDLDEVVGSASAPDVKAIIMVPAKLKTRIARVNITMPEDVLSEVDRYAEAHGLTRSGFLLKAARAALSEPA